MKTQQTTDAVIVSNTIMELVFRYNGSSYGLSLADKERLLFAWSYLSEKGVEVMQKWAMENGYKIPFFVFA